MKKMNKKGAFVLILTVIGFIIAIGLSLYYVISNAPAIKYVGNTQANILNGFEHTERTFFYLDASANIAGLKAKSDILNNYGYQSKDVAIQAQNYKCGIAVYPIINKKTDVENCSSDYKNNTLSEFRTLFENYMDDYTSARLIYGDFDYKVDDNQNNLVIVIGTNKALSFPLYSNSLDYYNSHEQLYSTIDIQDVATANLDPKVKAFLDMIAYSEGTINYGKSNGYNVMFTGKLFNSYTRHPNQLNCATLKGQPLCSTAAGRYQFVHTTWEYVSKALDLKDFSPESQDLAAVYLLKKRGALKYIESGDFEAAVAAAKKEWASFPGAGYNQPENPLSKLRTEYDKRLLVYNAQIPGANNGQTLPS